MSEQNEVEDQTTPPQEEILDLTFQRETIKVKSKTGLVSSYVVQELDGEQRDVYTNLMASKARMVDGKPVGLKNVDGLYAKLIHMALWDEKGNKIPEKMIQMWPSRVQEVLFKKIIKMSGLDVTAKDAAKND